MSPATTVEDEDEKSLSDEEEESLLAVNETVEADDVDKAGAKKDESGDFVDFMEKAGAKKDESGDFVDFMEKAGAKKDEFDEFVDKANKEEGRKGKSRKSAAHAKSRKEKSAAREKSAGSGRSHNHKGAHSKKKHHKEKTASEERIRERRAERKKGSHKKAGKHKKSGTHAKSDAQASRAHKKKAKSDSQTSWAHATKRFTHISAKLATYISQKFNARFDALQSSMNALQKKAEDIYDLVKYDLVKQNRMQTDLEGLRKKQEDLYDLVRAKDDLAKQRQNFVKDSDSKDSDAEFQKAFHSNSDENLEKKKQALNSDSETDELEKQKQAFNSDISEDVSEPAAPSLPGRNSAMGKKVAERGRGSKRAEPQHRVKSNSKRRNSEYRPAPPSAPPPDMGYA
eukprot:gnl/TRDRNA2_/TRDRNA2_135122_c0_seq1.p1 gnl/TRDRNA2_/TRDRNA2_135122_c0~~gnl/TRDRNA2_/TRDRNA2_135122_c0_seq1.p1  ORF type:complete len:425 (+),score=118.63 gnl/TRDRNA2_/TRDRNA2_135122_c0_seq1:82-1275(+)